MKILLDECVTKHLLSFLKEFDCYTVSYKKWNGLRNGQLMKLCISDGFDLLITIDKKLIIQQDIAKHNLIVVVFDTNSSAIDELMNFIPKFKEQLNSFVKGKAYIILKT